MRPSTTALSEMLCKAKIKATGEYIAKATFTAKEVKNGSTKKVLAEGFSISNETYGRDSRLYIHCGTPSMRLSVESFLRSKGVTTVDPSYWPGSSTVEVGVTYFKGDRWYE